MISVTKDTDLKRVAKPTSKGKKPVRQKYSYEETDENIRLLENAEEYWTALSPFREQRKRTRNYRMGLQWEDYTTDPDTGDEITEDELIKRNGKVPLKQNIIGQLANSFLGQWRSSPSKPMVISRSRDRQQEGEMMSAALEGVLEGNSCGDLDADRVNEFIQSGLPIQKIYWGYWKEKDRNDIKIKNINPVNIFFNTDLADIRGHDINLIGERIECTIEDVVSVFANSKDEEEEIREIYDNLHSKDIYSAGFQNSSKYDNTTFLFASEDNKVVLFEIWYLEGRWMKKVHDYADATVTVTDIDSKELEAENQNRLKIGLLQGIPEEEIPLIEWEDIYEQIWRVKYLSPLGHCFKEMDTPYLHDEHPYAFHAYPLIDGEIWGFLSEFIDQQRYINRLITLWDFIISSSAKGLLMIEENMIPSGESPESFALTYKKHNGLIIYKAKPGETNKPQWLTQNSVNVGIQEMLSLQLKLINDISGIQGAMQGQQPQSGTPASMYALQTQNSSINVLDKMKHFDSFLQKRNFKVIKLIKQFYDEPRFISIVGSNYSDEMKWYDPESIKDLEFDTTITKGKDAPAYRMMMDDLLMQLLQMQQIDINMYLENVSAPFADNLLKQIQQQRELLTNGQSPTGIPPEMIQQLGANPQALGMIMNNLKK